jgi:hypothetical protein
MDDFNWGMSLGIGVGNLVFWFGLVPWLEQRMPGQFDFFKGMCIGTMAAILTLGALHLTKIGT